MLPWLHAIKQTGQHAIILLSSLRTSPQERDWLDTGIIQGLLNKPFDLRELLALVQRLAV